MKQIKRKILLLSILVASVVLPVSAAGESDISVDINGLTNPSNSLKVLFLITVMAFIPSLLIMMTGFTRIVIVLSFVRNALGLQQTPPNQVLVGLAVFLTLFIMSPVIKQVNDEAYSPYTKGEITQSEAIDKAITPVRGFMLKQTNKEDLNLFLDLAKVEKPDSLDKISIEIVIPAFVTSELRRAFIMGFLIFLPFLIIDMVVSSVLMSMGMVMLPPAMISLPFKIILFVLVDGWGLVVKTLISSFN